MESSSKSSKTKEILYQERLTRYLDAMQGKKPDKVPIRLQLSEFMAKYAGIELQEIYYDLDRNIEAADKILTDFDVDVTMGGPSLWWGALHDAVGAKYLKFAGRQLSPNQQFQFVEQEYMVPEDYDAFIENPTQWILDTFLPRIHTEFSDPGSFRANLALIKGSAGMVIANNKNQQAVTHWAKNYGMPMSVTGMVKAPFDTLGDTLRGLRGIMKDLRKRPEKVLAALEVLIAHNIYYGLATSEGDRVLPVFLPLHRGSYPFLNPHEWNTFYWPSLKKVIEGLWNQGKRTMFYAEGNWTPYLERILELPERSIVFHMDQTDSQQVKRILGSRFCISGNVPNSLMAYGSPEQVREYVKRLLHDYAADGGFIIDTAGIMQTDVKAENVIALIETTRKYGVY
ncbi:uroporphyrinogen-III decarboxylase [Desulfitobacterium dichloroeliminans LMG P-21439]|uniref:Uroporphyrinogen-III decarboxylase n=1 Tax=Desulfitobacterium dichloroeliminans (strain LMG P-21439 / DCA1) TaxID=871963 RepID=L0F937_DESDL|nr:uroporphyrinogen decarboxylase family protein [Desulfitobacterium dichloroeliminans]AGA69463.1 uroporphyrinogen-III decarboxylase [Desulfitobacterium dichloroeliminans LMG P-21439]